eukprot:31277-Pelagococcus_subviridis.AAC.1
MHFSRTFGRPPVAPRARAPSRRDRLVDARARVRRARGGVVRRARDARSLASPSVASLPLALERTTETSRVVLAKQRDASSRAVGVVKRRFEVFFLRKSRVVRSRRASFSTTRVSPIAPRRLNRPRRAPSQRALRRGRRRRRRRRGRRRLRPVVGRRAAAAAAAAAVEIRRRRRRRRRRLLLLRLPADPPLD